MFKVADLVSLRGEGQTGLNALVSCRDTAGQERFRSVTRWQYRGVKVCIYLIYIFICLLFYLFIYLE